MPKRTPMLQLEELEPDDEGPSWDSYDEVIWDSYEEEKLERLYRILTSTETSELARELERLERKRHQGEPANPRTVH